MTNEINDIDPVETREWLDALQSVLKNDGEERAIFLLKQLLNQANTNGFDFKTSIHKPYRNTLRPHEEKSCRLMKAWLRVSVH